MKNFIYGVVATLLVALFTSFTPVADKLFTVKPAIPIATIAFKEVDPQESIIKYVNKGYIVQNMSSYGDHYYGYTTVVMVKY